MDVRFEFESGDETVPPSVRDENCSSSKLKLPISLSIYHFAFDEQKHITNNELL